LNYYTYYKKIEPFLCNKKLMRLFFIGFGAFSLLLMLIFLKSMFVVLILLAANVFMTLIIYPFRYFLSGIEIVLFSTVLSAAAFGSRVGAIVGFFFVIVHFALQHKLNPLNILIPPLYAIIGYVAGLSSAGITTIGITAVILYNIFAFFLIMFAYNGNFVRAFIFNFVNIAFNVFIFARIAPFVLKIVG